MDFQDQQSNASHRWKLDATELFIDEYHSPRSQLQLTEAALAQLNELSPPGTILFDLGEGHLVPVSCQHSRDSSTGATQVPSEAGFPNGLFSRLSLNTPNIFQRMRTPLPINRANGPEENRRSPPQPLVKNLYLGGHTVDLQGLSDFRLYPSVFESPETWLEANLKDLLHRISVSYQFHDESKVLLTDLVRKGIIYERCTIYIYESLRGIHTGHVPGSLDELLLSVEAWSNWDVITALHNHHSIFDKLQSFHPMRDEAPLLKKIITLDMDSICARTYILLRENGSSLNISHEGYTKVYDILRALLDSPHLHPSYRDVFTTALTEVMGPYSENPLQATELAELHPGARADDFQKLSDFKLYSSSESPEKWLDANHTDVLHQISTSHELDKADKARLADWVNKGIVYERYTVYVYGHIRAKYTGGVSGHPADPMAWVQSERDTIAALHNHHLAFDKLQHLYPLRDGDTILKKIIALDMDSICVRIYAVLHKVEEHRRFMDLSGNEAQGMLNLLQTLLDTPSLPSSYRHSFTNALMRLSKRSGLYPESLLQTNVSLQGEEAIAAGQFGDIWMGIYQGRRVAVKVLKLYLRSDRTKHLKQVLQETLIWRQLRHPNILPFLCLHHVNDNSARISLVSPWMENGNVRDFLQKNRNANRIDLVQDVAEGLEYLHTMQPAIVHGDLKAVNILITDSHSACLADFGLSTASDSQVLNLSSFSSGQAGGTSRWTAPELLNGDQVHNNNKTDVYAFGCVCYEIFSGTIPFHNIISDYPVIIKVIQGQRPSRPLICEPHKMECTSVGLDNVMWRIVEDCWAENPDDRPTMSDVIARLPEKLYSRRVLQDDLTTERDIWV